VGRGAYKLAAALDSFAIDPTGLRCLDVGASTGGFTDVLLQRGAAEVVALDVGFGQLHERIRADPRVTVLERTNMRHTGPGDLGPAFSLVVADVSFISLRVLLSSLVDQLAGDGDLVLLIKPQFEVGHREASRGRGVITDPKLWRQSIEGVVEAAFEQQVELRELRLSPISGGDGNVEFLARFSRHGGDAPALALVDAVIEEATAVAVGHLR
jgi:23S rRNA (cytidine1920-2'-O)/16S rRNA (cytidine1409-2'-O)-methyltransferase